MKKVILLLLILLLPADLFADTEWTKSKEKDGIVVFTRQPEGSKVKEFKASTEIEASLSSLVAVIADIESFPQWYKNTGETKLLKKISNQKLIYYYEVLVSFPFKNRDMVQQIEFSQNPTTKIVTAVISNLDSYEYESSGKVRMPIAEGRWTFTPQGNGSTLVEHQFLADPGGSIPKKIVNMLIVGGPYHSLKKLKDFVKEEKYQSARHDWLSE